MADKRISVTGWTIFWATFFGFFIAGLLLLHLAERSFVFRVTPR